MEGWRVNITLISLKRPLTYIPKEQNEWLFVVVAQNVPNVHCASPFGVEMVLSSSLIFFLWWLEKASQTSDFIRYWTFLIYYCASNDLLFSSLSWHDFFLHFISIYFVSAFCYVSVYSPSYQLFCLFQLLMIRADFIKTNLYFCMVFN